MEPLAKPNGHKPWRFEALLPNGNQLWSRWVRYPGNSSHHEGWIKEEREVTPFEAPKTHE